VLEDQGIRSPRDEDSIWLEPPQSPEQHQEEWRRVELELIEPRSDKQPGPVRAETEVLVQHVLACEPLWKVAHPAIVDVGTGSGCIVLSLAMARPNGRYIALDTSPEALDLARENAAALGIADRIGFAPGELSDIVDPESLNAVVANLPYIPTAAYERLPPSIRDFEPRAALDGGPAGLSIIETVISEAELALLPGGYLFLEIGDEQGASVLSLLKEGGFEDVRVKPDLNGRDRIALGRTPAY